MHVQQSLKQDALKTLQQLPEDVDINEIMYRLYVIDKIHRSREAIEKGEVISHEELLKEIETR